MLTIITNGRILTPKGWIENGWIIFDAEKIIDIGEGDMPCNCDKIIDAKGNYILPGGIDTHVHGGGGHDFMEGDEEAFRIAANTHLRHGTTAIYPTLAAASKEIILKAAATTEKLMAEPNSTIMGLHLEGPYFNITMAGGQIPEYIRTPDRDEYTDIIEKTSCIKRWDAAPELEGAIEFGRYMSSKGIIASIAHTTAGYKEVKAAYDAGYSHATHFYNAMTSVHKKREFKYEGTIESIYLMENMSVELVADGIHVPPAILRMVHRFKGVERTCLITDAMGCTASNSTTLYDPRTIIEDGVCKLSDRSALAGSIATMDRLIRTMVQKAEIPLADAVRMASETPARIMGIYDRKGSLEVGKDADIIIMDENLGLQGVWSMGQEVEL